MPQRRRRKKSKLTGREAVKKKKTGVGQAITFTQIPTFNGLGPP